MEGPEVGYGKNWWPTLNALEPIETARSCGAVEQFLKDPNHSSLNLHPLQGDRTGRLHTIRASKELRILLAKQGNLYLLLEAGHHDDIYDRAQRMQFIANPHTGFVDLVEPEQVGTTQPRRASAVIADDTPRPLDHWSNAELEEAGCSPEQVAQVRDCRTENDICELPTELFELVIEIMELTPEQWRNPTIDAEVEAEERLRASLAEHGTLAGFTKLFGAEEAAALIAAPIEDWMVFLHPNQRTAVTRRYEGPARVRGSAGTGKTVVGLHRAAELADRYRADGQKVLFTTFIKSLPPVFAHLYERIPGTHPNDVEFINVDKLAGDICREAGISCVTTPRDIDAAYASAWKEIVTQGSPIQEARLTRQYMREEIQSVIKGRGISTLDYYLMIERTGRSTRFGQPLRTQTWELHQAWAHQMSMRGTIDFADRILMARAIAQDQPPRYRAAIIDEAQDITMVGLQFVRALVNDSDGNDRSDGLLIVGDGAQRIYPGGFTLRQAGIEVRGRTTVLKVNYRNTREVIDAAMAATGSGHVDDLGDTYNRADERAESAREGAKPRLAMCESFSAETAFIAAEINALIAEDSLNYGDMAVAVATNQKAKDVHDALTAADVACQMLDKYDGVPSAAVKVGTHHRIKGLEFKVVFLPGMGAAEFPRAQFSGQDDDEYVEQRDRSISQLFVAMTRARDLLYVSSTGNPADLIADVADRFELVTPA
jgi:superfamily I DNA/RNA helicase